MPNQIILTAEGREKLENELQELKGVKRPDIIQKIEQAKELGDLSENAEYHDAKDQQGVIESRIYEIEDILKKAINSGATVSRDKIDIGTRFVVSGPDGSEKEYTLVGFNEANPQDGKISNESPMGQAFLGKKPGDRVEVEAPKGNIVYNIVKIN
ncbi:MAG: transcription elongation factor GreA [Parcubacteria group bacterium]